jgi:hypothetical protein
MLLLFFPPCDSFDTRRLPAHFGSNYLLSPEDNMDPDQTIGVCCFQGSVFVLLGTIALVERPLSIVSGSLGIVLKKL